MSTYYNLADFEPAARARLPRSLFGFIEGGAEDGRSVRDNRAAFDAVSLVPRVLRDTSRRDSSVTVFGETWSAPFGIAPMGAAAVAGFRADLAMAQAAADEDIPYVLSGASLVTMERVARVNSRMWFQIYASVVAEENDVLVRRARDCGVTTLVLTVDVPVSANREQDLRNGYTSPLRPGLRLAADALAHPRWLAGTFLRTLWHEGMPHFENFASRRVPMISRTAVRSHRRDSLDWDSLRHLRDLWPGRLVVKGVLAAEDARQARQMGADAVVVSNHGGRQLDGAIVPLKVLPRVLHSADGMAVFCDSGVRRGTDVIKLVGLGTSLAFVGRPFLYAAAVGGTEGVRHAIRLLKAEVSRDMALLGATCCADLTARIRLD